MAAICVLSRATLSASETLFATLLSISSASRRSLATFTNDSNGIRFCLRCNLVAELGSALINFSRTAFLSASDKNV